MEANIKKLATSHIDMESVIFYRIEEIITTYDEKIFQLMREGKYEECNQLLSDFCFELLELSDVGQEFIARTFFIGIVTDIIRVQKRKRRLHPRNLTYAYALIAEIERWENLTEFILNSTHYIEQIRLYIIAEEFLVQDCPHLSKALQLIDMHLREDKLTVSWLAGKLKISTTHLTNLFKLRIGEPVSLYITKRKLNEIIFEMTYSAKTLKEIRQAYGYHNHSHFIQHFKKHFGTTPLKYMQEIAH